MNNFYLFLNIIIVPDLGSVKKTILMRVLLLFCMEWFVENTARLPEAE